MLNTPSRRHLAGLCLGAALAITGAGSAQGQNVVTFVNSRDRVPIAVECAGAGPTLLLVHGGTGDRTRWTPLFPLFSSSFTVCAMDRRGHGASGDSPDYNLQKEAEDVAAVVDSRPTPVFVLGHSYGGVAALEAAFVTRNISRLVLYEPPLQERDLTELAEKIERLIRAGERERALIMFMEEGVQISAVEVSAMRARPSWPALLGTIESQVRQMRALNQYRFDAQRMRSVNVPTLLLTGSKTASPELKRSMEGLMAALPNRRLEVFEGQEHNAMDTIPEDFARTVVEFLLEKP